MTSEIKFNVTLDENKLPEAISWQAGDSEMPSKNDCKAIMLSIWDSVDKSTLRIDLWTKDMPLDDMKRFFYESFMTMADTYERASSDEDTAQTIRDLAKNFGDKVDLLKK
jgi:gliding motility-associated protein GldC